ncbi:DUF1479 family protein, partial [Candidatus Bathyarchaeota archaeon]|nr:DUF1479 family protein [Candidatus Bathyarchaeota archaeon]
MSNMLEPTMPFDLEADPSFGTFPPFADTMPFPADPFPLPARFARIKADLIAGREAEVSASWTRLLAEIRDEISAIAFKGSAVIPEIDLHDAVSDPAALEIFSAGLRSKGAAIIRNVISPDECDQWSLETNTY